MSIYRVYNHNVFAAKPDSKAKDPRKESEIYSYPLIREEKEGSVQNPHEKETFLFESVNFAEVQKFVVSHASAQLTASGRTNDIEMYTDLNFVLMRGLNDISNLELDPKRVSQGGGTRDGSGLKVSRFVDKLWAGSARGATVFTEIAKSIPDELLSRVIGKLESEGAGGVKLVSALNKARETK